MTLTTVIKDVCATVGVLVPQSIFTNITANRTMQEMVSLANEMAQRIAYDTRDWTRLRTTQTYAGNGTTTAFDLPNNFKRLLLTSNVWRSTSTLVPMAFVPDTDIWLNHRLRNMTVHSFGEWTILGNQMQIYPVMPVGQSAYYAYLDKNCISLASGGVGDSFVADGDSFLLNERLLKLGMIWQWKAQKGSPYQEDMATYEDALASVAGRDSPAPILVAGKRVSMQDTVMAGSGSWPS